MSRLFALALMLGFSTACGGVVDASDTSSDAAPGCVDYVPEVWSLYPCGDDPHATAPRTHEPVMTELGDGGWSGRCACLRVSSP